ncbi:hypothetical protein PRIPAC_90617 [Pristionchus pacificus]|nr:hypothetical protein PRIPAC_90617 [Pristionchus pacificus]
MKQARSLASLSHDGVVRYNSCWIEPKPDLWQLCVCDLSAWLKHNKLRDLELAKMWFRQLVSGVAYLHKEGRIHRDLKPSNIMLGEEGNLKIGDLAISTEPLMENVDDIHEMQLRTTIGTPLYMPKEQKLCILPTIPRLTSSVVG